MRRTRRTACAIAMATMLGAMPAQASETGGGVYPLGAEGTALAGALPPPGVYLLGYLQSYDAGRFNDGKGNPGFLPDFHVSAQAAVTRLVWNTGIKILGADYAVHVVAPAATIDARVAGVSDRRTGFTDVTIDPLILGWHWRGGFHAITGLDINLPVGDYNRTSPANLSRHYWNVEPIIALAYDGVPGLRIDMKAMYDINFVNHDAQINGLNPTGAPYRSGQEFHMEYAVTKAITKHISAGVSGYYDHQTTRDHVDDTQAQQVLDLMGGMKGQVVAAGPTLRIAAGKAQIIASWQHEFDAAYRPQGDKVWLKFIMPLAGMSH
jgi:hypothetical protein